MPKLPHPIAHDAKQIPVPANSRNRHLHRPQIQLRLLPHAPDRSPHSPCHLLRPPHPSSPPQLPLPHVKSGRRRFHPEPAKGYPSCSGEFTSPPVLLNFSLSSRFGNLAAYCPAPSFCARIDSKRFQSGGMKTVKVKEFWLLDCESAFAEGLRCLLPKAKAFFLAFMSRLNP
jgi:hypothetical protein